MERALITTIVDTKKLLLTGHKEAIFRGTTYNIDPSTKSTRKLEQSLKKRNRKKLAATKI